MAAKDLHAERGERVDAAIAEFLLAAEAGQRPSPAGWLSRYADIADELREFLADQHNFQRMSESLLGRAAKAVVLNESLPRRFGEFELLRLIGQGGMGRVYEARPRDHSAAATDRVAIKLLHPWLAFDEVAVQRLQREAAATRELRHPHVIPVIAAGTSDGSPYLVMEFVAGESLDRVLQTRGRTVLGDNCDIASIFAAVADGLEEAHRHGVVHRDVKPSNLLLTDDGRLRLGDFGLARVSFQPKLTQSGEAVGSPAYMSPEQVALRTDGITVDHRSDLYSLGATLYEVLTGRPPFVTGSREQLLDQIRHDDPIPPRQLWPNVSGDLETICLKLLSKRPSDRFATATDLAEELRRVAERQPIRTRPPGWVSRYRHWIGQRERSRLRAVLAATAMVLAIVAAALMWQARQRAIALQWQQAIDMSLVVALTGDLKATESAIARAEQVGVSPEWLELLRGQVAFHRGNYAAAIQHLEPVALQPQPPVAALSLLATAQLAAGSWEDYETLLDRAETMTPHTAEDFLFQGQAEVYFDPRKAVGSLDSALRLRDTPLARLVRAEARANLAFDTNDVAAAEAALADAFIARDLLRDHPAALLESLNAHMVAAELFDQAGKSDRHDLELAQAEQTFRDLEPFRHLPTVIHNRALFLILTDREPAAFDLLESAFSPTGGLPKHRDPLVNYDHALALFRRGRSADALQLLESRAAPDSLTSDEAFLRVLLLQDTGNSLAARAANDELTQRYQTGLTAIFRPCLLLLLGDPAAATSASREIRAATRQPRMRRSFYSRLQGFNCGELTESDLLSGAKNSRWDQCESLFFAALQHLAIGNRREARQLFERCLATRCTGFLSWDWTHAILQRWQSDPNWPSWSR